MGPSWQMLRDMFKRHGVNASVKSTAISGTTSDQWAKKPKNLAAAATRTFGADGGPDFVWFTLGGNDLLLPTYVTCSSFADSYEAAATCAVHAARRARISNMKLMEKLFEKYPDVQVVQCGYDFQCAEGMCRPFARYPYCWKNTTCMNFVSSAWGEELLQPIKEVFPPERYMAIDVSGSCQVAGNVSNATVGHPNVKKGSPCKLMTGCEHPSPDGPAAWVIGEAFWDQFFEERLPDAPQRRFEVPPFYELPGWEHQHETDAQDVLCNLEWVPDLENGDDDPPPCDRTAALYTPQRGKVWEYRGEEGWVEVEA